MDDKNEILKGHPSTSNDDYQLNTTTIIKHAARNFPDREIVSRKRNGEMLRTTFGEEYKRIMSLANALEGLGIQPADKVGVLDWNTHRYFESYFAIPGIGAVLLQMNLRLHPEQLSYVANHSEAKMILVDDSLIEIAEAISPQLDSVEGYVIMSDKSLGEIDTELHPVYHYEDLLDEAKSDYDWPMIDETSAYSACYTSGTTGKPKGVYYSHRNIVLHSMAFAYEWGFSIDDAHFVVVPMFHGANWGVFFSATLLGAKLVFPGRYTAENPEPLVRTITEENVTKLNGAPAIFMPMLEYIEKMEEPPDWSGVTMVSGATEPPLEMQRGYKDLTGARITHAYGATETTPLVTMCKVKPKLKKSLSEEEQFKLNRRQGLPVPFVDLKIVDEEGKEVPPDDETIGEILVKSPWIANSYYDDPRTEEAFTEDGYWKSGDAATIDEEMYVKIRDRYKDVIKSGGEWISSVDMENAIRAHPEVSDAAVVGLEHPEWEERPFAIVVPKKEAEISKEDIIDFLKGGEKVEESFADWQLPDEIEFVDEVPKTSVGKNDKGTIKERYEGRYMG